MVPTIREPAKRFSVFSCTMMMKGSFIRYFCDDADARYKIDIQESILARLREHNVRSLIMMEEIFGCPHEEGIDYPKGEPCPHCLFWKGRDRFAGADRV
jgi:hypothetical protein